jgi:hypothetical protein
MRRTALLIALFTVCCSSSSPKPTAPPPASAPAPSPTPSVLARINPNIVEETETYYVERLPKKDYIKVDATHVKNPMIEAPLEFYKEDDQYFYVHVAKALPEEIEAERQKRAAAAAATPGTPAPNEPPSGGKALPASEFEEVTPPRVPGNVRLELVANTSLPDSGMWRASFVLADVNGDGIPDVVSPPARLGDARLHVWIGDGKGRFTEWPLRFTEGGKPLARAAIDYGGVAVGDIDGDGHLDVVSASHGSGLVSFFGDGKGGFEVVRTGLPARDFSSQAAVLIDADGDGKLDLLASRDAPPQDERSVDKSQVRLFVFQGRDKGWEFRKEGVLNANYSNCLTAWDYDGDGRKDLLTASHNYGGLGLLYRNDGNDAFSSVYIPEIQGFAYTYATAPGTWGKARRPAFAASFIVMGLGVKDPPRAEGVTLYVFDAGQWTARRLWRAKNPRSSIFGLAMGDLDGDGLDDVVFLDSDARRVRILYQQPDGSFAEADEKDEPRLTSPGQCVRLADLDRDGRLDVVVSRTVVSSNPGEKGGFDVYLNRRK